MFRKLKRYIPHLLSFGVGVVVGSLFFSTKTTVTRYVSTKSGLDVTDEINSVKDELQFTSSLDAK